jgi:RHS repeat-associated protein
MVYAVNNNVRTLESTNFGGGRINKTDNNMYDINYFITDHLGSTRVIVGSNGEIKEQKDYYPFGKEHENPNLITSTNRWGFSGKEKQTIKDLGFLDFGARMLETEIGRWFVIDPLAEKYYSVSPYVYCMNNPLKYVDPTGKNPEHPDEEEERRRKQEEEQRRKIAEQNGEFTLSFGENLRQALEIKIDLSTEEEREKASENQKQKEEQEQENSDNSDVAGEYLVKGMTIAAVASQMDSPLPGPGDVAGIGIAVGVTVTAGVIWLGEKIFDSFKDHRKGKDWQTHSKPRPGGDPANGRYGRGKNDNRGNKNRKYIPPPNPNKRP